MQSFILADGLPLPPNVLITLANTPHVLTSSHTHTQTLRERGKVLEKYWSTILTRIREKTYFFAFASSKMFWAIFQTLNSYSFLIKQKLKQSLNNTIFVYQLNLGCMLIKFLLQPFTSFFKLIPLYFTIVRVFVYS